MTFHNSKRTAKVVRLVPALFVLGVLSFTFSLFMAGKALASGLLFIHQDHLGSASLITDSEGNNPEKRTYYPFGAIEKESVIGHEPNAYNDKELDAKTKLYNFEARMYAGQKMHFTTPDTIVPNPANGQSWNRYAYVRNNPLKYIDPSGHAEKVFNNTLKVENYFQEAEWDDNFFGTAVYGVVFAGSESLDSLLNFSYDFNAGMNGDWEGVFNASTTVLGVVGVTAASRPMVSQLKESLGRGAQWLGKKLSRLTRRGRMQPIHVQRFDVGEIGSVKELLTNKNVELKSVEGHIRTKEGPIPFRAELRVEEVNGVRTLHMTGDLNMADSGYAAEPVRNKFGSEILRQFRKLPEIAKELGFDEFSIGYLRGDMGQSSVHHRSIVHLTWDLRPSRPRLTERDIFPEMMH